MNGWSSHVRQNRHRPQGVAPSASPLRRVGVSTGGRSMLPWAFDPHEDRRLCHRGSAGSRFLDARAPSNRPPTTAPRSAGRSRRCPANRTDEVVTLQTCLPAGDPYGVSRLDPLTRPAHPPRKDAACSLLVRASRARTGRPIQQTGHATSSRRDPKGTTGPLPREQRDLPLNERPPPSGRSEPRRTDFSPAQGWRTEMRSPGEETSGPVRPKQPQTRSQSSESSMVGRRDPDRKSVV